MLAPVKTLPALLLAATFAVLGCHAQNPPAAPQTGNQLSPEQARRIEVMLRQRASLPPGSIIQVGPRAHSELPGYDAIAVSFTSVEGKVSKPINFLLSTDGKTLAQFTKFDISADPRSLVSADGRPARGGPSTAPVLIVGFDDLECPYCASLHRNIFPAITDRYKDQVRIVYRDFPLDQHPWAMRAAVDTNCVGAQSPNGYWNVVDYIHAHAGEIGTPPEAKDGKAPAAKTLALADEQLDKLMRQQAAFQKIDLLKLDACIAKQDTTTIEESKKLATSLGVDSTPSLFINGAKIDGALPAEFLFRIIDQALIAEGKTPPPPYVAPATPAPASPSSK
ncbi:MAG: thioredoxin domain-containing protein [Acidobacteriaceae bacterium]